MSGFPGVINAFKNHPEVIFYILILIILFILARRANKHSSKEEKFALRLGLKPMSEKDFFKYVDKSRYSFLSSRVWPPHVAKVFHGLYEGFNICIFFLGLADAKDVGKKQTAIHVRSNDINLPKFMLKPTSRGNKLAAWFGAKDIYFPDNPEFSKKYTVKGENEGLIRSIFRAQVLHYFEQNSKITVESDSKSAIIFKDHDLGKPEQWRDYIERAISILKLLQNK